MKIKYLKDAPAGKKGDVAEVPATHADVLIKLGFAEVNKAPAKKVAAKKKTETESE